MVENDKWIGNGSKNNNLGQNLSKSKKAINLAKLGNLKNYPKLFKSKNMILDKSKNLVNLIMIDTIGYLIAKIRVIFILFKVNIY